MRGASCDVTVPGEIADVVRTVHAVGGRLDTVVACAGAALDGQSDDPLDALDRMYALHVRSVVALAEEAIPLLVDAGGGAFLIISSIAGLRGNRQLAGYGTTKAANAQIARNLAVRWGAQNVRANAISPGVIDTAFARPITADPGIAAGRLAKTPLARFGTADEVAGSVVWLAAPAGAFVTGQNIVIDGGTLVSD